MSIRIQYKGLEIFVSAPQEAVALIRQLTTDQGGSQAVQVRDEDRWEATLAFLSAIRDAGTQGAEVTQIMHALGVRAPKGVGSRTTIVDKSLKEIGFTAEEVYDNERTSQGRFWRAGPRLFEAIDFIVSKRLEDAKKQS
jgi:hypothetical protein